MLEKANSFNSGVEEDNVEVPLDVVPEELTNKELWGLEEGHIAGEEAREKEVAREEKEEPQVNSQGRVYQNVLQTS